MEFIFNSGSWEKRSTRGHLVKDAAHPPHVNGRGVLGGSEEDIRRPVPQCHNFVRVCFRWNGFCAGQAEIRQLEKNKERSGLVYRVLA